MTFSSTAAPMQNRQPRGGVMPMVLRDERSRLA
jgi:hypothetical protein